MKKQSITGRLLTYIVLLIVLSNFLIYAVNVLFHYFTLKKQATDAGYYLIDSNITLINRYFNEIDSIADSIIYNPDVVEHLKNRQDTLSGMQVLYTIEKIYYHSRKDMNLIFYKCNTPENTYSIFMGSGSIKGGDFKKSDWYRKMEQAGTNRVVVTDSVGVVTGSDIGKPVCTIAYRIYDTYSSDVVGYLRFDINLELLQELFLHDYDKFEGTVILDEDNQEIMYNKNRFDFPAELLDSKDKGIDSLQTGEKIFTYGYIENMGWKIVFSESKRGFYMEVFRSTVIFTIVLLATVVLISVSSGKLFNVVTENFRRLRDGIHKVEEGNLSTIVEPQNYDEIGELIIQFNKMVSRIDILVDSVKKKQILLNQAEINALQQQINPHFIFNCLETVMGLASAGMDGKVIRVCGNMSEMLRYNITFSNYTKLENEIRQMKNYIEIIKIRFENTFEIFYDIDEDCRFCQIMKFTLQPLVENAINHGLSNVEKDGLIRIRIKKDGESVEISIYDNGCGIEPEKLGLLNQSLQETTENPLKYIDKYLSLGLINVNLRMRMFFGEDYHMEILSKERKGTCIYLKIPYKIEEQGG